MDFKNYVFFAAALMLTATTGFSQNNHQENKTMQQNSTLKLMHDSAKSVSAQILFKGTEGVTRALQIKKDGILKEHITETDALLICISGEVIYEDEQKKVYTLRPGDYVRITPKVKHWVKGVEDSQLVLIK